MNLPEPDWDRAYERWLVERQPEPKLTPCEYCHAVIVGEVKFRHEGFPACSVGCVASLKALDAAAETSNVDIIVVATIAVGLIGYGLGIWL